MEIGNRILWAKGHPDTIIPTKEKEDLGYDIYARFDQQYILLLAHETRGIPTDLHCAMPQGFGLILKERGSTGIQGMGERAGVVDSGFRGAMFAAITNLNDHHIAIVKDDFIKEHNLKDRMGQVIENVIIADGKIFFGDKILFYPYNKAICQGIVIEEAKLNPDEVTLEELLSIGSKRGQGKLGNSGK